MGTRLEEFRKRREQLNDKVLAADHLGIKRFFNLDTRAYEPVDDLGGRPVAPNGEEMPTSAGCGTLRQLGCMLRRFGEHHLELDPSTVECLESSWSELCASSISGRSIDDRIELVAHRPPMLRPTELGAGTGVTRSTFPPLPPPSVVT